MRRSAYPYMSHRPVQSGQGHPEGMPISHSIMCLDKMGLGGGRLRGWDRRRAAKGPGEEDKDE
jgi:hypothetical protein